MLEHAGEGEPAPRPRPGRKERRQGDERCGEDVGEHHVIACRRQGFGRKDAQVDPVEYRLRYLTDPRAVDLVRAIAEKAKWKPRTRWGIEGGEGDLLYGRGFAYALYVHGRFPGVPAAWSAWVADVAVNKKTGVVAVTRITVGQDTGMMVNPDGVRHQVRGWNAQRIFRL